MLMAIAFYMFSAVLLASALAVVAARNPVHAVLCLILAFFNASGLFLLLGAEFLAMLLLIVYVGAVAVLFLFVVMMLDVHKPEAAHGAQRYVLIGGIVGLILAIELAVIVAMRWGAAASAAPITQVASKVANTAAIGQVLYTDYVLAFQLAGLVLLTAMVGAIVLALRKVPGVK
ncbi:MAG: NADH-quinone oxidoreductase subunit J, partial [Rhizomicrobium sp.]